jgi:hypothetical protein
LNITHVKNLEEVIPAPVSGSQLDYPGMQRLYGVEFSMDF